MLGNLSGDCVASRDALIKVGFADKIVGILAQRKMRLSLANLVCWIISNFCKGTPKAPLEVLNKFLPFYQGLLTVKDDGMIADTLAALNYYTEATHESVSLLLEHVNMGIITMYIRHKNPSIRVPATKIIGNICSETANEVEVVINADGLQMLVYSLHSLDNTPEMQREICWVVSNITAGPSDHIQKVIDSGLIEDMCNLVNTSPHYIVLSTTTNNTKLDYTRSSMGYIKCM